MDDLDKLDGIRWESMALDENSAFLPSYVANACKNRRFICIVGYVYPIA